MATPLYISQIVRRSGVVHMTVVGHGFTGADKGRTVTVVGTPEATLNGSFVIDQVLSPDTIRFKQSTALHDVSVGLQGGAMAVAATPLYIAQAVRRSGVIHMTVAGHGLTGSDKGRTITVTGAPEPTLNGVFVIDQVTVPDTIRYKQSTALHDIAPGLAGGAVAVG